jgi:hypothetical protein
MFKGFIKRVGISMRGGWSSSIIDEVEVSREGREGSQNMWDGVRYQVWKELDLLRRWEIYSWNSLRSRV